MWIFSQCFRRGDLWSPVYIKSNFVKVIYWALLGLIRSYLDFLNSAVWATCSCQFMPSPTLQKSYIGSFRFDKFLPRLLKSCVWVTLGRQLSQTLYRNLVNYTYLILSAMALYIKNRRKPHNKAVPVCLSKVSFNA